MFLYNTFAIIAVLFFLRDFFPYSDPKIKSELPPPATLHNLTFNRKDTYKPFVNRMVLIIIDALRIDFINSESTPFLYKTAGCVLETRVRSPTVTLPRIKALTTGSVPQFMDVVYNLVTLAGGAETSVDGFLWKLKESGRKIVFYGDDTWLKLYGSVFERKEGVSSFYVNDFEEVDLNVSRNVIEELEMDDWDLMVLHYLGLDHIGHVYGPFSNLVKPKLLQMDQIIQEIHTKFVTDQRNVILVTGDHGMKDSGGHGGSSHSETHVPLVSIGLQCNDTLETIEQIDVATTLSVLFGTDIPSTSVGKFIFPFLPVFDEKQQLYILLYNALALNRQSNEFDDIFLAAFELHKEYLNGNDEKVATEAKLLYVNYLKRISGKLLVTSSEQNIIYCLSSVLLLCICFMSFVKIYLELEVTDNVFRIVANQLLFVLIFGLLFLKVNSVIVVSLVIILLLTIAFDVLKKKLIFSSNDFKLFMLFGLLHSLTFFSSSFIEEEHQFWYFSASSLLLYKSLNSKYKIRRIKYISALLAFRFLRKINQTGDKFSHLPDLADWLLQYDNKFFLTAFTIVSLILLFLSLFTFCKHSKTVAALNAGILIAILPFKMVYSNSYVFGRLLWFFTFVNLIACLFERVSLINSLTLTFALLLKPYNIILLPAAIYGSKLFFKSFKNVEMLTFVHMIMANALYFCQGNSNSFASIDVASGYVGLKEYIPIFVMLQVLLHTYALPILSFALLVQQSCDREEIFALNSLIYILRLLIITTVAVIQRQHLFIWTVFSPKVLAESINFTLLYLFNCIQIMYLKLTQLLLNKTKKTYCLLSNH